MAAPTSRWWRATLRYHGRILEERRLSASDPVLVGPGGDVQFVLPGLAGSQVIVSDGQMRSGNGLFGVVAHGSGEGHPLEHGEPVTDATVLRISPIAHRDIELELRAESGSPFADRGRVALLPGRELAYGFALAGCIVGLLAVAHQVTTLDAGGGVSEPGRIERFMMASTPATFATAPMPVAPAVPLEWVPIVEAPHSPDHGMEPIHVALGERSLPPALPSIDTPEPVDPGEHSHTAPGQPEPGGLEQGPAAEPSAFDCDDPQASPKPNIDVVFVIDVSTTMSFMLRHLSQEIAALDEVVRRHDAEPRYGLAVFVDDVVLVNGGKAYADVDALRRDFEHWAEFTSSNRQLRSDLLNLDWPENSLDALHVATAGFDWRPAQDTLRVIVHATDDDFGDGDEWLSGGQVRHGYAETVNALQVAQVRVATFAARIGGRCECENVEAGFFSPYRGQPSIPDATGGAVFDIDEVASRRLRFADALSGLVRNTLCD